MFSTTKRKCFGKNQWVANINQLVKSYELGKNNQSDYSDLTDENETLLDHYISVQDNVYRT